MLQRQLLAKSVGVSLQRTYAKITDKREPRFAKVRILFNLGCLMNSLNERVKR